MRVLHFPTTTGGQAPALAAAERALGIDSFVVADAPVAARYPADRFLCSQGSGKVRRAIARIGFGLTALGRYDVVHFNGGQTMLNAAGRGWDLALWRACGSRLVMTFQGSDARPAHILGTPNGVPESFRRALIANATRFCTHRFCLNPDLLEFVPDSEFLPYVSSPPSSVVVRPPSIDRDRPLRIVHAPTKRHVKGTEHVLAARDALREFDIEWRIVEGVSQAQVGEELDAADLVIDQLRAGWYGVLAVEAMLRGKPVICHISEASRRTAPPLVADALPIVDATPQTITEVVRELVAARERLADLSRQSRHFAATIHDPSEIARRLVGIYREGATRYWPVPVS